MDPETRTNADAPTCAKDVMTDNVITARPDSSVAEIGQLLLDHGISAVPVVSDDGVPIGMVSEGDLLGRPPPERLARRDWWLAVVTGAQPLDDNFRAQVRAAGRTAREIMTAPLVTVSETTGLGEIARLLSIHHIKRVPVLRDGHLVGIVSRADVLRAIALVQQHADPLAEPHRGFFSGLFGEYHRPAWESIAAQRSSEQPKPARSALTAENFRQLVEDFHNGEAQHRDDARRAAASQRRQLARELIDAHVSDDTWRAILHRAREAAEAGQAECMTLRFPCQLCIDGGRAINTAEADWPETLRGEAAEIYLRWERDLKPRGFALSARVLEFPDGKPGDIGLFLAWGAA
jgi:CBS domain-containing protein